MTSVSIAERLGQDDFLARSLHRDYVLVRGAVAEPHALVSFGTLNALISMHRLEPPRLRLSAEAEIVPQHRYAVPVITRRHTVWQRIHPDELHQQLAKGASLVLDAVDELHEPITDLAQHLEGWLRTRVQVNAYASWTASEGFGTHWDDHDVIVVQIDGSKRWRLFGPTRTTPLYKDTAEPDPPPDQPLADVVLHPGDVLYLPRGWWHAVSADQGTPSLHLTCGLTPHTGADLVGWLSEDLRARARVRTDLPLHATPTERAAYLTELRTLILEALDDTTLLDRFATARDAEDPGRPRPSLPHLTQVPAHAGLQVRLTTGRARLTNACDDDGQKVTRFSAIGQEIDFSPAAAPLLHQLLGGGWHPLARLAQPAGISLADAAAVVTELVIMQAASVRDGDR
ncbi:cupin domain-containing protein [Streptomyces aureus]|uniref:cupin domain-containing protein n=1 Tax=Streptomyces aureus TaxID=193461 RepID=UPI0005665123|nr:cupin domain-containing protein [Streptomyces aureus]